MRDFFRPGFDKRRTYYYIIFAARNIEIMSQLSQLAETLIGSEIVRLGNEIKYPYQQGREDL